MAELFMDRRGQLIHMLYDSETNQELWNSQLSQGRSISDADYIEHMLVNSGRVDRETINEIKQRYSQLHKSGIVDRYRLPDT